jgi:hypothetical protein
MLNMAAICEQCELGSMHADCLCDATKNKADLGVAAAALTADDDGDVHLSLQIYT